MSTDAPLQVDPAELPNDPAVLKALVTQLVASLGERDARIAKLERHMDLLVRRLYGRTSEKLDPRQLPLFDVSPEEIFTEESPAAEVLVTAETAESAPPETPARRGHGRRPKPDTLRRVDRVYDLTDVEKQALAGDGQLEPLGEEVTEQYEWEPSCLYVVRHIQKKYVRRPQRLESGETPHEKNVIIAAKPPQPIPGGVAGPGLLAHVLVTRFADHLPYHRQEDILARYGLSFSRQTTCGWALSLAELATPLIRLAIDEMLASRVLHTDDTPVKVRDAHQKLERTGRFAAEREAHARPLLEKLLEWLTAESPKLVPKNPIRQAME